MNNNDAVNVITLKGRIVSVPKLNTTKAGVPVTSFTIAVDRRNNVSGARRKSDFFTVVCWRENAEYVCKHYTEVTDIVVDGEMQTHRHPDKNGNNMTWYEVVVDRVLLFNGNKYIDPAPVIPEQNGIEAL